MQVHESKAIECSILASILLLYIYPLFLSTPLLDPDEGLHAAIAQEMVETGDYLTPRVRGEPFLDKPILYFFMQALSLRAFGMNEAAVRLPGVVCALCGVATTYLLAWRLFDKNTGLIAALTAVTMTVPLALAQAPVHDIALVPWTNLLLLCWWNSGQTGSQRTRLMLTTASSLLIALALLTKGLIGVAVVGVGYFLFLAVSRLLCVEIIVRHTIGFLLGCLLASPWFIAMEASVPGYLRYYFIERHLGGFATATQQHGGEPWHYYLPILLGGAMPWTLHTLPGLWPQWQVHREPAQQTSRALVFTLCWLVGGLLFLSVASSKLITYCLPLFPAIAILAAHSVKLFLHRELLPRLDSAFSGLFQLTCAVGIFLPTAAILYQDHFNGVSSPLVAHGAGILAGLFSLTGLLLFRQERRDQAVATATLWSAFVMMALITWPLQITAQSYSQRALGLQLASRDELPDQVLFLGDRIGSVVFYLTSAQRRQLQPGQFVTASDEDLRQLKFNTKNTLWVFKNQADTDFEDQHVIDVPHGSRHVGSFEMVEFGSRVAERQESSPWK